MGSGAQAPARGATLAVTNLIKLGGLVVALHEALVRTELRPSVLAVSALMMAGAQVSEGLLLALADRFFGTSPTPPTRERSSE